MRRMRRLIKLVISDHGKGFDWKKVTRNESNGAQADGMGYANVSR